MIRIENLNKYYNKGKKNQIHVINNTNISFPSKGLVTLLGRSGCGKTTLLNVIGGLDKANNGNVYIDDIKLSRRISYKKDKLRCLKIGYIFQDYKLIETMNVYDNVALALKMIGIKDKKEIKKRVEYILDRVGILRYRYRPCNMLSGGERQRVGIARALVKNPDIILADEPTGNLDSKNTIEVMNIIKAISRDKLVILVTHEVNIAHFYADRILEITDGEIVKDTENKNAGDLDLKVDNKFYLRDFAFHDKVNDKNLNVSLYGDEEEKINLSLVIKNGNIYINTDSNKKVIVADKDSNIEFIDDNYKKIDKSIYQKYSFDYDKIINNDYKLKYSSIFNIFSIIKYGFNKIFSYSFIKKLLLVGFFLSAMFVTYAVSNILGVTNIKDSKFITINKNYLMIENNHNNVDDYLSYEKMEGINYLLPGDSIIRLKIDTNDYYQLKYSEAILNGSLSSIDMINEKDLIYGRMPENSHEIVLDKMIYDRIQDIEMTGIYEVSKLLNRQVFDNNNDSYLIVGITDLSSPSIYTDKTNLWDLIINSYEYNESFRDDNVISDYEKNKDKLKIVKGREPKNDYEVIVNNDYKYLYEINKNIDVKVNNNKLKVVGYYTSPYQTKEYYVSEATMRINKIVNSKNIVIYAEDDEKVISDFKEKNIKVKSIYEYDRNKYISENKDSIKASVIVAVIMLVISLVEIILMTRSSFLSRIKEVGIFRAIGVKKSDIYKMFMGEAFAISTIAAVPGVLFMGYIIYVIRDISFISDNYVMNGLVIIFCIVLEYIFNIIVSLIPVFKTIIKTPAGILSKNMVD